MPVSNDKMKIRNKIATDLRKLQGILLTYFPTAEISSFESAMSELRNNERIQKIPNGNANNNYWGYSLNQLIFNFNSTPRHTIPDDCKDLKLILDIKAIGDCNDLNTLRDTFKWLEFNIVIEGTRVIDKEPVILTTSYHLDRHIQGEEDGEAEYPHPLYHFQFGGRKLKENNQALETGHLIVFDSPRVAHYPMEAILGIDFTLSNFFPQTWSKMRKESNEYMNLIVEYQNLILKPYIHTHASQWKYSHNDIEVSDLWSPITICPQLINS
ncbi:MAG: hypothetical protein IPM71_15425 [Bacteroidota bacterium]|nr:MAG: hypothetical protein IPM71_15425 [Bacteroidota bacterium]